MLYPGVINFLKYCREKGLKITLSTNGYLLPKKLRYIREYIDNARMSVYGMAKIHNFFTGNKNSFKRLEESLKLLKKENIPALMIMPTCKSNIKEIEEVVRFCIKYGVKRLRFFTLIKMGRAEKIFKKEGLACKDIEKLKQTVGKLQKKNPSILLKVTNWNLNSTCCFIIEPNGECWFYYANKKEFVGSLLKNSLDEIWNNFKSKDLVNYLINLR